MKMKVCSLLAVMTLSPVTIHAATFVMEKYGTGYSIDGNNGAIESQQIYLWPTDTTNENQHWVQLTRDDGYYAYKKYGTNLCWDGGDDGDQEQAVTLETCDEDDYNQHWNKIKIYSGTEIYRFEKRNASDYSLDGNNGADYRQLIYLWDSDSDNENQQWELTRVDDTSTGEDDDYDLDASAAPSENFDLWDWYLSVPSDNDDSGTSDDIKEDELNDGYEDDDYFYTGSDGGMVFVCPIDGYKTSSGTSYTRTELREMLRRGDTDIGTEDPENNWAFSSISSSDQEDFGGIDGVLEATVAVNHVTSSGDDDHVGRVIIGQIHAEENEPARLYYRLLPNHSKGSIYLAHEPADGHGSEQWYDIIGSRDDDADEPSDGIELDEVFSYTIEVDEDTLWVTISRDGYSDEVLEVDMEDSGYDDADNYMFFKAGVYNQNNSGDDDDYVQATFYRLENSHDNYDY